MRLAFSRFAILIAILLGIVCLIPPDVLAQEVPTDVQDGAFFQAAVEGIKTVSTTMTEAHSQFATLLMTAILIVSQLAIQLTKTSIFGHVFKATDDRGKLVLVAVCTVFTTFLPLVLGGVPIMQALGNGAVLTAFAVAGHQIYKAFLKRD